MVTARERYLARLERMNRPVRLCAGGCGAMPASPTSKLCIACRIAASRALRTSNVSYGVMHQRVARLRGKPSTHQCQHCDQRAEHWAYDHADPDQRMGTTRRGRIAPFSLDAGHYLALCRSCHTLFDNRVKRTF
jgi:hypothetical protein